MSPDMDVNTLASKRSELIGNAEILGMRRVIHNNLTCVCLRLPVAAIRQKRKNASVDLWPALHNFHWSNAKYINPSRETILLLRPHQCDSEGGRIRGVLRTISHL